MFGGSIVLFFVVIIRPQLGSLLVPYTHFKYEELTTTLAPTAKGKHDLFLVFKGTKMQKRNLFNFDWWKMTK